jgi:hypothetical protein
MTRETINGNDIIALGLGLQAPPPERHLQSLTSKIGAVIHSGLGIPAKKASGTAAKAAAVVL